MNLRQLLTRDNQKRIATETMSVAKDRIKTDVVNPVTQETSKAIEQAKTNVLESLRSSLRYKRSKLTDAIEHDLILASNAKEDLEVLMLNDGCFKHFYDKRIEGVDIVGNLKQSIVTLENTIQALENGQAVIPHNDHKHLFAN